MTSQIHGFILDINQEKILHTQVIIPDTNHQNTAQSNISIARTEQQNPFNPFLETNTSFVDNQLYYDSLFLENGLENGQFLPLIASNIIFNKDNTEVEIHIHPKASFANQEGIFSDDVITSIENLIQKGSLRYHYLIKLNLTFSELSNKHFLIKSPKPISISSLVQIGLLPITQRKSLENNQKNPEPSGAYHIQSTKNNHYHILKRNKNYWAKDLPSQANMTP